MDSPKTNGHANHLRPSRLVSNIVATISAHVEISTAIFCSWNVLQIDRYRVVKNYLIKFLRNLN